MLSTVLTSVMKEGFDVKALRAFRVLRPLRLVSGVPSKSPIEILSFYCYDLLYFQRSSGRSQFNFKSNGAFTSHCTPRDFRHHYIRYHWIGAIFG